MHLAKRRRTRTRWSREEDKLVLPGLPTILPSGLTAEQVDCYLVTVRIEEISLRLRTNDVLPPADRPRSPSPPPEYGPDGRRTNLRQQRYIKKLEHERTGLIDVAIKRIPGYQAPGHLVLAGGKRNEKLYIPAKDFPDVNFIGLLIGPRGNTLKKLEADSGAKISIRGKGSVKEGKIGATQGEDEELHALIMGDSDEKITKAILLINKIIETAASVPEGQNELKRLQLRELAALNGTLREEDIPCTNCGELGHQRYDCHYDQNVTINMVCKLCGGIGHLTAEKNNPNAIIAAEVRDQALNTEYASLMADLGENKATVSGSSRVAGLANAPWLQAAAAPAAPAPWQQGFNQSVPGLGAPGMSSAPWMQPVAYQYTIPMGPPSDVPLFVPPPPLAAPSGLYAAPPPPPPK